MKTQINYLTSSQLDDFLLLEGFNDYMVIDEKVKVHLPQGIRASKKIFWLKTPEAQKNSDTYLEITNFFLDAGITREKRILAIGGGATTDLAGFVAATILRGVDWISIPTTLLGMVDAAIGGKVGINTKQGKNQIGAFHLPLQVLINDKFLSTLNETEKKSGLGEIVKYCFLSPEVNKLVHAHAPLEKVIKASAIYKNQIVESDFKEKENRKLLNLGHTLGHAYERLLNISHGEAVVLGLRDVLRMFELENMISEFDAVLKILEIKVASSKKLSIDEVMGLIQFDKKKTGGEFQFIVPMEIGDVRVVKLSEINLRKMLEAIL